MNISFIIQARVGSSRMPQKILLPFYDGMSILDIIVQKLKNISNTDVIIAAPDTKQNDIIEEYALKLNVKCFRGSEYNVLDRFIGAAEMYGADRIIRICSDNPFLSLPDINNIIHIANSFEYDYISFLVNGIPSIKTHYGFYTEYVTLDALCRVRKLTQDAIYREHVTNYIYTHPDIFNINWLECNPILIGKNDIRLTIDTPQDFDIAKSLYKELKSSSIDMSIESIVNLLYKRTDIRKLMLTQIFQNTK